MAEIVTYQWREGTRYRLDPEVAASELDRIKEESGKEALEPRDVVAAAALPGSALHSVFCWDNDRAAARYREHQARKLIHSLVVVVKRVEREQPDSLVLYVHTEGRKQGYRPTLEAMDDDVIRQRVLNEAVSMLQGWTNRYAHLQELQEVVEAFRAFQAARAAERASAREQAEASRAEPAGRTRRRSRQQTQSATE